MTLCYRFLFFSTGTPLLPAQNCGLIFPLSDNLECGNENCVCRVVGLQCVCVCVCVRTFVQCIIMPFLCAMCWTRLNFTTLSSMEYLCVLCTVLFSFIFSKKGQNGEQVEWIVTTVFWFCYSEGKVEWIVTSMFLILLYCWAVYCSTLYEKLFFLSFFSFAHKKIVVTRIYHSGMIKCCVS